MASVSLSVAAGGGRGLVQRHRGLVSDIDVAYRYKNGEGLAVGGSGGEQRLTSWHSGLVSDIEV